MSVFVKKGACIAEKISDEVLCLMAFFIPDSYLRTFLCENNNLLIRGKNNGFETVDGIYSRSNDKNPSVSHQNEIVIPLEINALMHAYFESLKPYFFSSVKPHEDLLDLKFRELLFNLIGNPANEQFNNFLETLISSQWNNIRPVIEANYCFNLKLNEYARLCNRSLSSFKRDFYQLYGQPPAKWLLNKRLSRSRELLFNSSYPIDDISFESGFKNSTHFSHAFKKYFGISPLKYRQKIEITKHSF